MKMPNFAEGVLVAFLAAALGAAFFSAATLMASFQLAASWVVLSLGLGYLLYLVGRAEPDRGRLPMLMLWAIVTVLTWSLTADPWILCSSQFGLLWLVRSLLFHSGPIAAAMDLGLVMIGALAAFWVLLRTGSPFLAIWSLFLVQALFVSIPQSNKPNPEPGSVSFERAERAAERAISRLSRYG